MMMQSLIQAGTQLAEALGAENEALSRLDLLRATQLADAKIRASDAFAAAFTAATRTGARAAGPERSRAEALSTHLRELSAENRRLLERAITLQSRVIETIATAALPRAQPTTYGSAGLRRSPRLTPALTLTARA
ncbi:hypothetical protein [Roseomonas sp. BN140053]|uniref:hypothetical protein n=1 Tax=Roseomonas sp. BN140053 TaxID=3391898 RepID=UPI0039E8CA72